MKVDQEIIGMYALHLNGYGPVMRIVGYDIDNSLMLRYKCQWKENCVAVSSLFKRSDLDILSDMPSQPNQPGIIIKDETFSGIDRLGNPEDPITENKLRNILEDLM